MKVAIIGAGFGGLAAAFYLSKAGFNVTVFESDNKPGGLAVGFGKESWDWSLEKHYHHWFTSDWAIRNLAKETSHNINFLRPKTSTFIKGEISQLDSPLSLLAFNKLPLSDRLRTGAVLAYLKSTPYWKLLEPVSAEDFIKKYMGDKSWDILWQPLFKGKFQKYASGIPASWFWARIKKRSPSLGYPEGGFLSFAENLVKIVRNRGGKIYFNNEVNSVELKNGSFIVKVGVETYSFDRVICTLPSPLFIKITKDLPEKYINKLLNLKVIGAVNLLLSLNRQFLTDSTYWLNINASHFPFLAVVEHTNFIDKKHYGNEHLLYIGNYLQQDHKYFKKEAVDLIREFYPYLKTINPKFTSDWVNDAYLFKAFFAQPIIPLNYSKVIASFETPIKGLYLCNIQQVYPWDRGTNYAVENGEKVAELVLKSF